MEATCSSETSGDFKRITWRYIPEDRTFHICTVSIFIELDVLFVHPWLVVRLHTTVMENRIYFDGRGQWH
jgi:hypothetical protein